MCRKTVFVEHNVMGHNVIRLLFCHLVLVNLYKHTIKTQMSMRTSTTQIYEPMHNFSNIGDIIVFRCRDISYDPKESFS